MLVLSRHISERIILRNRLTGEIITVTQVDVRYDKGRIGLDASLDWVIMREELLQDQENQITAPQSLPVAS